MKPTLHLFLYVVARVDDPYSGIRQRLSGMEAHSTVDIRLTKEQYEITRSVEYSSRKYIRVIHYRSIFSDIERLIDQAITSSGCHEVVLYLADEGVWAEIVGEIKQQQLKKGIKLKTINVQHGFFVLSRRASERRLALAVRKIINAVSKLIFGYPNFGLTFGRGKLDVYLVYGDNEAQFLRQSGHRDVFVCPQLIKQGFVTRFEQYPAAVPGIKKALFVMPHFVPGTGMKCDYDEFLRFITPLFTALIRDYQFEVFLRFHPGMKREEWYPGFQASAISNFSQIDECTDIAQSMSQCSYVFGLHSTALFEAMLVGKVPVSLYTPFLDAQLEFTHEALQSENPLEEELGKLMQPAVAQKYRQLSADDSGTVEFFRSVLELTSKEGDHSFPDI
ncbi:MAG: hypothetical protein V7746_12325 [Halioglobus sp.]